MKYAFIEKYRAEHPVWLLCRKLEVSQQGYYQWRKRPESKRELENQALLVKIRLIHAQSKGCYGSIRVHRELVAQGFLCNHKRVARLMRANGLRAKAARKFRATTDSKHNLPVAPNLVQQNFDVAEPNKVWVGDITYLWTDEGWMYLAVFIDLFSRRVVGWALKRRMKASLVTLALERAMASRRPVSSVIVHSDRGSQYASKKFRTLLKRHNALASMSRKGNCWDNAVAESFFHSLKVEAVYGERFETRREMEVAIFQYIERFYNKKRRHSSIGYLSPFEYERKAA